MEGTEDFFPPFSTQTQTSKITNKSLKGGQEDGRKRGKEFGTEKGLLT